MLNLQYGHSTASWWMVLLHIGHFFPVAIRAIKNAKGPNKIPIKNHFRKLAPLENAKQPVMTLNEIQIKQRIMINEISPVPVICCA